LGIIWNNYPKNDELHHFSDGWLNHQPDIFDLQDLVRILLRYNWDNNWNIPGNYSHMATHTWLAGKFPIHSSLIFPAIKASMASLGIVQPRLMTPEGKGYREPRTPMPKRTAE